VSGPGGWYELSLSTWMAGSAEVPQGSDVLRVITAALAELGFSRMDGLSLRKVADAEREQ